MFADIYRTKRSNCSYFSELTKDQEKRQLFRLAASCYTEISSFKYWYLLVRGKTVYEISDNNLSRANWVFQPKSTRYKPISVCSFYTFTTAIMLFKICDFGGYPPTTSAFVKESGTFRQRKKLQLIGTTNHSAKALTLVNGFLTTL